MYKSNKTSQILLTILIFITVGLLGAASGHKCAAVGEYCQNHWECCSNSCMTYLYKCVRSYNIYPYTFLSYEPPRRTIEEILELNFGVNNYVRPNAGPQPIEVYNRFQGANEVVPNNQDLQFNELQSPTIQPITSESPTTLAKANATNVYQTASRLGAVKENVPTTTATDASLLSTTQSPSSTTTKPATAATSSTITSSTTTTAPPAKCSEIGVKCYRNEECCTERCHGFLHQCVT